MTRNTRESLALQWPGIFKLHEQETKECYQASVRSGNTQTYSVFVEEMREGWIKEMLAR